MSDAKVAYGFDGRGKVWRRCRFGQNLPQTSLSVFSPKTLPLPAIRLKGIRQRKQATDGKSEDIEERLTDEAGYWCFIRKPFLFLFVGIPLLRNHRADGKLCSFKKIMYLSADRQSGSRQQASFRCRIHGRGFYRLTGYRLCALRFDSPEVSGGSLSTVPTPPCR